MAQECRLEEAAACILTATGEIMKVAGAGGQGGAVGEADEVLYHTDVNGRAGSEMTHLRGNIVCVREAGYQVWGNLDA